MKPRQPRSKLAYPIFPYTTLFRSKLHRVEGGSLRRQHRPRTAYETHQTGAGSHPRALLHKPLDPDIGVKRTKEGLGDRQPRHYNGIAALHHAIKTCIGRDHCGRGDVAPFPQVFGKRFSNEWVQVEARSKERREGKEWVS